MLEDFIAFRAWQAREIKRWTYAPAACSLRKKINEEWELGRAPANVDCTSFAPKELLTFPEVPDDSPKFL